MHTMGGPEPFLHRESTDALIKHFPKMYRHVGMAVPKTTATWCRDRAYKHCTNNPIPTSFFVRDLFFNYALKLLGNDIVHEKKM